MQQNDLMWLDFGGSAEETGGFTRVTALPLNMHKLTLPSHKLVSQRFNVMAFLAAQPE